MKFYSSVTENVKVTFKEVTVITIAGRAFLLTLKTLNTVKSLESSIAKKGNFATLRIRTSLIKTCCRYYEMDEYFVVTLKKKGRVYHKVR